MSMFGVLELCAQYKGLCQRMSISASVYAYFHIYPCGGMLAAYVCTDISGLCHRVHELPVRGSAWLCVYGFVLVGAPALGGRRLPTHSRKACVCAPTTWGLCLDRSCRCTVQGRRRLARVQTMCVHSCVSWPRAGRTPRASLASAE